MTDDYPPLSLTHVRATEWRSVHISTNPDLVRILSEIPDYVEARRNARTLADYEPPTFVPPPNGAQVIIDAFIEALDAGEPLPTDVRITMEDAESARRRHDAMGLALEEVRQIVASRLDDVIGRSQTKILAGITTALREVVEQARAIVSRGGRLSDADSAIAAGRVEDYKAQSALEQRYTSLRTAQIAIVRSNRMTVTTEPAAYPWHISNPVDAVKDIAAVNAATRAGAGEGLTTLSDERWPDNWGTPEALWWFAERDAQPWAASQQQHDRVQQQVSEHLRDANPRNRKAEKAKQRQIDEQLKIHQTFGPVRSDY